MTEARRKRNEFIGHWYVKLLKRGLSHDEAVGSILDSEENKLMCLKEDTIRLIVTYKDYGKTKAEKGDSLERVA